MNKNKVKYLKEQLMVSVLPAHIALEMKTKMIREIRKAQMKSYLTEDEFVNDKQRHVSRGDIFYSSTKSAKTTASNNFIDTAARKLSVSLKSPFLKSKINQNNQNINEIPLKPSASVKKNSGNISFLRDKPKSKTGFHDLHIKSHNNVRLRIFTINYHFYVYICIKNVLNTF